MSSPVVAVESTLTQFFLIVPPGLEEAALWELEHLPASFTIKHLETVYGGITVEASLLQGVLLNHYLKTPTRVLLRIGQFKASDFPKLYQRLGKLPWSHYLSGSEVKVSAAAKKSRLIHTGKVAETLQEALDKYFKGRPPKQKDVDYRKTLELPVPQVFLRLENDVCTVAIDTSGERLGKRFYRTQHAGAPLRENLAAGLLTLLLKEFKAEGPLPLIDPMCGSGTFVFEGHTLFAPNIKRPFAYQTFPVLHAYRKSWESLLSSAQEKKRAFSPCLGMDKNLAAVTLAKKIQQQAFPGQEEELNFLVEDVFKGNPTSFSRPIVVVNPPYGGRLSEGKVDGEFYSRLLRTIEKRFAPQAIGLIVPLEHFKKMRVSPLKVFAFSNGGIEVVWAVFM